MIENVLDSAEELETIMGRVSTAFERAWEAYSEERKPSRHGKKWWNEDCKKAYQEMGENGGPRNKEMRNKMRKTLRVARRQYFDKQIHNMASDRKRPWDLMPWTRERKMPAVEAILDSEGNSCNTEEKLFETLHNTYNAADNREVDVSSMYREIEEFEEREWVKFSIQEFHDVLKNCAKNTAPGPDHVSWRLWKRFATDDTVCQFVTKIANSCFDTGYWPQHFKQSISVIIPKPGKPSYDKAKSFRPIVLLNTMGKLIEKMIARRLQFESIEAGVIHPCQTGGILQRSVEDAAVALTHHVRTAWAKKKVTSVLAFDVAQFFPSLNHNVLSKIFKHFGFSASVASFFSDYNVGVGQGSALLPILSALYIAPCFHLLDKWVKDEEDRIHFPLISFLSFVDDGLLVATGDCRMDTHDTLKEAYAQMTSIFKDFGLVMEHTKTELFNFADSARNKNSPNPSINLGVAPFTRESPCVPKDVWRYLGIMFDRNLIFRDHVKFYSTKSVSAVRCMKSLGNSNRGLTPKQKRLLYISCIQPIATFGLCCWYKPGTRAFKTNIKMLRLTHNQGARWITGAFRTSPMGAMTAVAGLMPLHLQLKKLFERSVIRINTLHPHHPVLSLLEQQQAKGSLLHPNALERKSKTIRKAIKSLLDSVIDNPSSEIFDPLSEHIKPGHRLVDRHPDKVKFVLMPKNRKDRDEYHNNLNLAPVREPSALHLFTAGVKHKFDLSVPIPHRTHSHIALVTAFNGRVVTSKTRAAGRRVNEETIVGWSTFLALIKAHKKLQKRWPISKVILYTTSQLIVKNLMSTNSKPLRSQLSIAVSLAFDAIVTDFPEVDIEVRGFNKSWATAPGFYAEDSGMLQPLAQRAYHEAEKARTFTERSLQFPQSASYHYTRQKTTRDAILLWQLGFQGVRMPSKPPPHMPSSDGRGTRQGLSVRSQMQDSPYHIKTCFKGNSWYDITDKGGNEILPSHLQGGPWFQTYQGVKAADNSPLFARLMRVMCNHAPIGEYRVRFFPDEPYKACQCDLKSPETRQHLLMVCSLFVRRINHYDLDGITTICGLILFLQDNPQAFSFEPPELPRHADESWPAYRRELELARDEENKKRKKKRLPPLVGPIFLHESIKFVRHWNVWEMDEGWGDIFRAIEMRWRRPKTRRNGVPNIGSMCAQLGGHRRQFECRGRDRS
ncbi:hypothetical protein Agabi119p4_10557 [Agaricus bisporus var. burnettii]|uniref:Reverse transcriptase domain-containing protein n=1 Tax=Agaricus bisporus var. burnettii TaxID=192524 RepID=A0A8H7C343_AGABI|nr:hypothetical protein Agabi119p4_10557 [Agaricus bisporus var. burnettii]